MNILIVEDDESVARFLEQVVVESGYVAQRCEDGVQACEMAETLNFDLILLDIMLPQRNGFEVCRYLRSHAIVTPILLITARDTLEDKIEGLDSGADDYIVKPFQIGELLARMRALLRRGATMPSVLRVGDLTLDPATRQALRGVKRIYLSATEYSLLEYLMRNAGKVLPRAQILEHVWNYQFEGRDNVLEVYISYLRGKIDRARPALIHTVRGVGYCLELRLDD
jgi:DNA-binding response OmpR family regulator